MNDKKKQRRRRRRNHAANEAAKRFTYEHANEQTLFERRFAMSRLYVCAGIHACMYIKLCVKRRRVTRESQNGYGDSGIFRFLWILHLHPAFRWCFSIHDGNEGASFILHFYCSGIRQCSFLPFAVFAILFRLFFRSIKYYVPALGFSLFAASSLWPLSAEASAHTSGADHTFIV